MEAMPGDGSLTMTAERIGDDIVMSQGHAVGVPEEEMQNIFTQFYTTKPGGMGLGLAYCKKTVEAHGGDIHISSEQDKGTTVTVTIPI